MKPLESEIIIGVDEAGRGPLAGPVVAAAVILDPNKPIAGLGDSKKLSQSRREALYGQIQANSLAWAIAQAEVEEIDDINILQASMLAMQRAVHELPLDTALSQASRSSICVLVDGNRCPQLPYPTEAIVKGDSKIEAISAASILAKVARDRLMCEMHQRFPEYEFDRHKGYPTARHRELLKCHGACITHRRSFGPVASVIAEQNDAS